MFNCTDKQHCTQRTKPMVSWKAQPQLSKEATYTSFPDGIWIQHEHGLDEAANIHLLPSPYFTTSLISCRERVLREPLQPPSVHNLQRGLAVQQPCITKWVPLCHRTPSFALLLFVSLFSFLCLFVSGKSFQVFDQTKGLFPHSPVQCLDEYIDLMHPFWSQFFHEIVQNSSSALSSWAASTV